MKNLCDIEQGKRGHKGLCHKDFYYVLADEKCKTNELLTEETIYSLFCHFPKIEDYSGISSPFCVKTI